MPPLLNLFCFCWVHTVSVLYCAHLCMRDSLRISNFIEEISSLSHSIIFLYFFAVTTEEGFLFSPCYSLEVYIHIFAFLFCLSLLFFFQLFVSPPQSTTSPSCISFSWRWFWSSPPIQCYELMSIVLQALCLPDLVPWIYSSPPMYHKGFDLDHTWMP